MKCGKSRKDGCQNHNCERPRGSPEQYMTPGEYRQHNHFGRDLQKCTELKTGLATLLLAACAAANVTITIWFTVFAVREVIAALSMNC